MDKLDNTVQIWFVGVHTPELDRHLPCNSGNHSAKPRQNKPLNC